MNSKRIILTFALALFALAGCGPDSDPLEKPNVLLISIDTLRADHLGCYGYQRDTSPFLDSLAKMPGVILFDQCISQAPNTAPSHMSLFTSLHPVVHGVPNLMPKPDTPTMRPPDVTLTLAQVLRRAGYQTAGIADGGYLNKRLGFDRGFETYHSRYENAAAKVDRSIEWLASRQGDERPFLLFFHSYEVHGPYLPPEPFRDRFTGDYEGWIRDYCFGENPKAEGLHGFSELWKKRTQFTDADVAYLKALYDAEIAYMDSELKRLWEYLEAHHLLDDLVVVITSDHGEEFGEHGEFSHKQLYDEIIRVPLILRLPPGRYEPTPDRVADQVSLIDVMPTLLDLLEIKAPPYLQGRSARALWKGERQPHARPAYSSLIDYDAEPRLRAVRFNGHKLMTRVPNKPMLLYNLEMDPAEKKDHAKAYKKRREILTQHLDQWQEDNEKRRETFKAIPTQGEVDQELYDELKALGY